MPDLRLGSGSPYEDRIGYSRVVRSGDTAWTAGCTSSVEGVVEHPGDAGAQARAAFRAALSALERVDLTAADVVHVRMYVRDPQDCDAVGLAHHEFFAAVRPAATMLVVGGFIDPAMLVEVELVAHRA
jgi:enamine deaminase RidA (YjgF/YER057c/UK114 family)